MREFGTGTHRTHPASISDAPLRYQVRRVLDKNKRAWPNYLENIKWDFEKAFGGIYQAMPIEHDDVFVRSGNPICEFRDHQSLIVQYGALAQLLRSLG